MKRCTIIREINKWYCCISVEDYFSDQKQIENAVGIDRGIENLMALSTGEMVENPRFLNRVTVHIKELQRALSRKKKDSRNREKARTQLAKSWRKVRNQRLDYCHKESAKLAARFDTVVFEDLKMDNMVRNHNLAQAIMDANWGQILRFSAYKVERCGGRVILVNPNGTSQICSRCGKDVPKDLSVRTHQCPYCGLVLQRHQLCKNNPRTGSGTGPC